MWSEEQGRQVPVPEDEPLLPCVVGMSMGWSWALYFANETVASRIAAAGGTSGDAIRERQPVPSFAEHPTLTGTYVE